MPKRTKKSRICDECQGTGKTYKMVHRGYPMPPLGPPGSSGGGWGPVNPYTSVEIDCPKCKGNKK